jgi:hypothetical protein
MRHQLPLHIALLLLAMGAGQLAGLQPPAGVAQAERSAIIASRQACVPSSTALCLTGDRFQVEASFQTAQGSGGEAKGVELTEEAGYFWFFDEDNVEIVLKVVDACVPPFNRFWVFVAGLTNVEVTIRVTDTETGQDKSYFNPQGQRLGPIQDTNAFATCP